MTPVSRRRFGQGFGACLALATSTRMALAQDGPHVLEVRISGFVFTPERLEIFEGDTVIWINDDVAPHTATAVDGDWDTGRLRKGQQASHTFEATNEFEYFCVYHPHMKARVIVRPKPVG